MLKIKTGLINFIKKLEAHMEKYPYPYAFFIPFFIQLLLFAIYQIYPLGDQVYLRMDCYHQYAPFLKEFYTRMHSGSGLFFAWENGLGVNYWAHYAYYLSSPLNLVFLLFPKKFLLEGIEFGIILKGSLASVSFLYYLNSHSQKKDIVRIAFSCFYGLSAYMLAYSCNVMWPETYILFPLIMLGVERITQGKSSRLYGIALCLSVFANFYITIIAGIAIVLYFIVNLIIHFKDGDFAKEEKVSVMRLIGENALKTGRFFLTTIVVCLITAIFLLPVYLCLKNTNAGAFEFPTEWESYFGYHELFGRMLANVNTIQSDSDLPNLYASVLAFLLTGMYMANSKVPLKSKISKGILILALLFSFQWNIPTYIWHGFHFPNSFPARHSFFFIFLLLSMGAECYEKREGLGKIEIVIISAFYAIGCGVLWFFLSRNDLLNGLTTYLCSILFIVLYGALMYFSGYMGKRVFQTLILTVALIECLTNTLAIGINSTVNRDDYVKDEEITQKTLAYLDELNGDENAGFYRVEEYNRKFMNEAAWDGYKGASYFSSTISDGVRQFYADMGLRHSDVAYSFQGSSPFLTSFFGVKYILSGKEEAPGETFRGFEFSDETETVYVYENSYPLSVGFAVPDGVDEKTEYETRRPFKNQNELASLLMEDSDVYLYKILPQYEVEENQKYTYGANGINSVTGTGTVYFVPAGKHVFFYVNNYIDSIRILIQDTNRITLDSKKESDLKFRHILDLGVYEADRFLVFISETEPDTELTFQAYCFQEDTYLKLMEKLSEDQLTVTSYSSNGLKGNIICHRDETLLFSIPYDEGFTVMVDGVKTESKALEGAFLSVPLSEGEHSVEISYIPPGFVKGLYLSLAGILLAAVSVTFGTLIRRKKAKQSENKGAVYGS